MDGAAEERVVDRALATTLLTVTFHVDRPDMVIDAVRRLAKAP
jgi:hypothetical protein